MILDQLADISTFIFDVDGVLTPGSVIATDNGEMHRTFNIKDGFALKYVVKQGYQVIIISGGNSDGVRDRLHNLGIKEVHTGVSDKRILLAELQIKLNIDLNTSFFSH